MSLKAQLEQTVAAAATNIPADALKVMQQAGEQLRLDEVGKHALSVGDQIPDATLRSATGDKVRIADLYADGPLIISFYRGGWCPYCNLELRAYQEKLDEIKTSGGTFVAITPETPDNSLTTTEKNELTFPVLTDTANRFAVALGIAFELPGTLQALYAQFGINLPEINEESGWALPIPATFVIDRGGKIVLADVDSNYTRRLEPDLALDALRSCLQSV